MRGIKELKKVAAIGFEPMIIKVNRDVGMFLRVDNED